MKSTLLAIALLLACAGASAQTQRFDIYGGAEYWHASNVPLQWTLLGLGYSFGGWELQPTYNFTPHFGVSADFDGLYGSGAKAGLNTFDWFVGPKLTSSKVGPFLFFAHAMPGQTNVRGVPTIGQAKFALASGGGVDMPVGAHFSLRLAQVDYVWVNGGQTNPNMFRYSGGVVWRFGQQ